jgi:hypothetical protein
MGDKRGNESEKGIVLQGGWMGDAKIRLLAAISELSRGEVAKAAELVVDTAGLIKFHMDKATQIPGIHVNTRSGFLVIGNTSRPPLPRPTFKPAAKPAAPGGIRRRPTGEGNARAGGHRTGGGYRHSGQVPQLWRRADYA